MVLEIASWINAEEAGTFFGQHAILVFSLVLAGLLAASISLSCLLYQLDSGRVWPLPPSDGQHLQDSSISSAFRDRLLGPLAQVVYRILLMVISAFILPSRSLFLPLPAPAFLFSPSKSANKIG
jgi:hypothetical protein